MFMDKKTQYCEDVTCAQIHLYFSGNPNQNLRFHVCVCVKINMMTLRFIQKNDSDILKKFIQKFIQYDDSKIFVEPRILEEEQS